MVRLILLLSFSFLTKQQSGGTLSSQPSAPSQPFEARNSISPPPQKLVSMPVESMVTDLLSVSLCCVYFCNLLSGWGLRGLQLCFLCDRCSRFAPSKSIFITNQQAAFCLLLLRGSGDICYCLQLQPQTPVVFRGSKFASMSVSASALCICF